MLVAVSACAGTSKARYEDPTKAAASSAKPGKKQPIFPMTLSAKLTCKDVVERDTVVEPLEETNTFKSSDRQVVAFVAFDHIVKTDKVKVKQAKSLRWKWYAPSGELYAESKSMDIAAKGPYHLRLTAYHAINVAGEKASTLPGEWHVIVEVDDTPAVNVPFKIERTFS
ncbi:MAG: hypothetical protein HYV63_30010 [Candidatus Schekmanbacteria bacterium]|nr:hypothetical protein [Candidatus Schekmanbacteria bacterium]